MAKFSGKIGYISTVETEPGIWEEKAIEKQYYGDLVKNTSRFTTLPQSAARQWTPLKSSPIRRRRLLLR